MNLYEIKEQYKNLLEKIENGEISEDAINDTLESVEGDFQDKADNIASFIKSLLCEAVALKEEAKKLIERQKAKEGKAESLRLYLENMMLQSGIKKIETARNILNVKLSPPSVEVDDNFIQWAKKVNPQMIRIKEEPDKEFIKSLLKIGPLSHCRLVQNEKLNIK